MDQRGLVERAQRGDHDAFAALAGTAIARLDAAARLILRDHELARDAVQEALVRAWRDLPKLRDPVRGLRYMIKLAGQTLQTDRVFFGVVVFMLMGIALFWTVGTLERRFERWRPMALQP